MESSDLTRMEHHICLSKNDGQQATEFGCYGQDNLDGM